MAASAKLRTPGFNVAWYAAAAVFIDPQNVSTTASDANDGFTSATALLTWAEAVRRWGGNSPLLTVALAITFLSSHVDDSDPVVFNPIITNGVTVTLQGAAPAVVTAGSVFTRTATKSRVAGANSTLQGSFSAGAPAAGMFLQNTTAAKSSLAFVYASAGGANWNLTQPIAPVVLPVGAFTPATEVDTWNTGDTINLLQPIAVNIVELLPIVSVFNGAQTNTLQVHQLIDFDPGGLRKDLLVHNGFVTFSECFIQRVTTIVNPSTGAGQPAAYVNTWLSGLIASGTSHYLRGGALVGSWTSTLMTGQLIGGRAYLTSDIIINTTGFATAVTGVEFELVYLDSAITIEGGCFINAGVGGLIYGSAAADLKLISYARLDTHGGTWTAACTFQKAIATGISLNGAYLGNSIAYAANIGTIHNGIATTVANLDAAAGAAGFGGVAFVLGGASVSNVA